MKIGNPADKPIVTPASTPSSNAASSAATGQAAATQQPAEASAQVALSSTATALLSSGDADFNAAKVESVSQSIERGEFKVNAEVIADKLISNAAELLSGGTAKP
jgi:negative regulator of flagellin synthesis FlgM